MWQAIGELAARGTTVLLTTHYLDEADKLCDRISVIDQGRNVVEDTPTGLKRRIGNERLEVVAAEPGDLPASWSVLTRRARPDRGRGDAVGRASRSPTAYAPSTEVAAELRHRAIAVADLGLRRPTLDEAFLHLTGDQPRDQWTRPTTAVTHTGGVT